MTDGTTSYYEWAICFSAAIACIGIYVFGVCLRVEKKNKHWWERYAMYSLFWAGVLGLTSVLSLVFSGTYLWLITTIGCMVLWIDYFYSIKRVKPK